MIHNRTGTFIASGNMELFYQCWLPEKEMKAVVAIVHGGGDHSGRFGNVTEALVPEGYGIFMLDLRGHGRSPGKRGHINSWKDYRDDLSMFLALVRKEFPSKPLVLFGHSMGAVIVLDYCLRSRPDLRAVICTSPAIGKLGIPPFLFFLARVLDRIWPSLVLNNGLVVSHLSRDPEFVKKTKTDPLYHTRSTPRFGIELLKTVEYIQTHAPNFNLPLFLIHGTDDEIASVEGSRRFIKSLTNTSLTYKEYEKGYHELFNDLCKDVVLDDLVAYLEETLKTGYS